MSDLVKRADEALKDVTPYDGDLGLCEHCADNQATLFSGREAICTSCHDARLAELVPAMRDRIAELEARAEKAEARVKELEAALTRIEAGLPAGSTLSDCRDPLWRDAYRELQRIARTALKGEKT